MSITTGVGLVSGLDYESIISQISDVNRAPIRLIQQKQATMSQKSEAFGQVMGQMRALQTAADKISTPNAFLYRTGASSDKATLSVTADDTADIGSYSVKVLQLAQAETKSSQGFANADTIIGTDGGSFTVKVGSAGGRTYDLDANTTLTQLRNMINEDTGSDVRATIVNDGTDTNAYRMVLSSKATGSSNTINITSSGASVDFQNKSIEEAVANSNNTFDGTVTAGGTYSGSGSKNIIVKVVEAGDLSGGATAAKVAISTDGGLNFSDTTYAVDSTTPLAIPGADGVEISFGAGASNMAVGDSFTVDVFDPMVTKAQDAMISVDGITVRRDSNTFTGVIDGVTFEALKVSDSAVTASVKSEPGLISADIMKFATSLNEAIKTIDQLRDYDEDTKVAQPLFGDSATRSFYNQLKRMISNPVGGNDQKYSTLASLGMKLQVDGTYAFDTATLNKAIEEDIDAVTRIFSNFGTSSNDGLTFVSATDSTAARDHRITITQAAEKATVTGAQAFSGALGANENLSFDVNGKVFTVNLSAGDGETDILNKLNNAFSAQNVELTATFADGKLTIESNEYGSAQSFKVTSDQDGSLANQLGVGTTQQNAVGKDVVANINGRISNGEGQTLQGVVGTDSEGLIMTASAATGTTMTLNYTRGLAGQVTEMIDAYVNSTDGIMKARQDGISKSISNMNDRIDRLQQNIEAEAQRMRNQFIAMERQMAQYQDMGSYITRMLAQIGSATIGS